MNTITKYIQVSDNNVVMFKRNATVAQQRNQFNKYVKTYRLAYGHYPSSHSLQIELTQYTGLTLTDLTKWLNQLKSIPA